MPQSADTLDRVVDQLLTRLADAWNASDASRYAECFHPDTDFVDVLGRHLKGKAAVEHVHRQNFTTIHRGSHLALRRMSSHLLADSLVLALSTSTIRVPAGPLAGESAATQTMILTNANGVWRIRAFQNTLERQMPGAPPIGAAQS